MHQTQIWMWSRMAKCLPSFTAVAVEAFRFARFSMVGIAAAICYAIVTFLLVKGGISEAVAASVIGHLCAGVISYLGHLHFSFALRGERHRTFLWRFIIIAILAFALNILLTWLLTVVMGASYLISIAAVMILIPLLNYVCNRFWVFRPGIRRLSGNGPR